MNAPKFPIYIVTLLFVVGMLIPPWTENECLIWSSVIIPFLGALFKKYRVLSPIGIRLSDHLYSFMLPILESEIS
ncbi:MAG: hypothetical protein ACPGC6_03185 [Flavobacteriaceae bacterium]